MSDGGANQGDLMRLWLDAQAEAIGDKAGAAVWDRAEALFRAWSDLLSTAGPSAAKTAPPFDPSEWLKPADPSGMAQIGGWLGGALGGGTPGSAGRPEEAWHAWTAALNRHREITGAAWLAAFREFAERSRRETADAKRLGTAPPDWQALSALWREIADEEFSRTQRSDEFLATQATLLEAGLACRRRLRERIEVLAELAGMPTRAEVDDMAREIDRLRRELRGRGPE